MQRLQRRAHPSLAAGAAALAAASAACSAAMIGSQSSYDGALAESLAKEDVCDDARHMSSVHSLLSTRGPGQQPSIHTNFARHPTPLTSSPISSIKGNHASIEEDAAPTQPNRNRIECDYVVIGHGKAGRSAVRTLRRLDPSAHIVIIDPNNTSSQSAHRANTSTRRKGIFGTSDGSIRHIPTRAGYIDHAKKLIHVHPISGDEATDRVHFRKSALLATGSRGAPPPEGCIRHDAYERILELRSTALPQSALGSTLPAVKDGQPQHYSSLPAMAESQPQSTLLASSSQGAKSTRTMPVLDPPTVRSLSIMAASQGATVAVMGSGFDALELAAACARASPHDKQSNDRVMLLFGNSSPMSQRLPRYLGAAVTKRLRQFGIGVEDRALTRYISMDNGMGNSKNNLPPRLELYAVKSYDHLDSSRMNADLLVLAPSVRDLNGTAVVATPTSASASTQSVEHVPWSSLISPPLLTCYLHDGRIATNPEFNAASSVYAAGSVARYPDNNTGRAEIAGGRHICSEQSGEAAARSMVGATGVSHDQGGYLTESIHVWRSDVVSYLPDASTDNMNNEDSAESPRLVHPASTQALYSMGIHALCIGKCDSEGMATHGFWWTNTNQSSDSKNGNGSKGSSNSGAGRSIGPNAFMRRATRRANSSRSKPSSRGYLPVYGSGVVFYLDRSGNIEGVMLWGLPFSQDPKDVRSDLNDELVERIKDMIRSNGGVAIRDHSERILEENPGTNIDVGLLSYLHLMAESKHLVSTALSGSMAEQNQPGQSRVSVRGRPLHRYTPIKPVELTNLGKLARRDESGHLAEEDDLFYTAKASSHERADEAGRPPSLKRVYPMQGGVALAGTEEHELEREMERRRLRIERSRPPKEEPLWLRQGEEHRFVNRRDAWAESFLRNVQAGRFSDGTDAVKQAPVPKAYLDAKEMFSGWAGNDDEKDE